LKLTKDTQVKTLTERQWRVLGKKDIEGQEKREDEMGYTPQVTEKKIIQVTVLEQSVEELDLPQVLAAVNGLKLARTRS
jgi:hypothetical protein